MKSLGMWAMVCLAAFIIGKTAKTENKEVSDVVLENVEAEAPGACCNGDKIGDVINIFF